MINLLCLGTTKQKILKELYESPSYGYEISKRLSLSTASIYEHFSDLREEGFIKKSKKSERNDKEVYALTKRGKLLVRAIFEKDLDE